MPSSTRTTQNLLLQPFRTLIFFSTNVNLILYGEVEKAFTFLATRTRQPDTELLYYN